ncbi:MAG: response regulator [Gemmatimonadetes bacterium]|nr:response regulator [Gemmatimonadota bacterium]
MNDLRKPAGPPALEAGPARAALILIAEDHLDSRDALRALLEASGYRVLVAVDGRQALTRALEQSPDLIIMDITMPEMDGFEAICALRRHAATRLTPIIATTALEGVRPLALQAGASDFVRKPIDGRELLARVQSWLQLPLA